MTAATNPQTVAFGSMPATYGVSPLWRNLQVDNQTNGTVNITVQTGTPTTIQVVTVNAQTQVAIGMATALNNPNLDANNHGSYDNSTGAAGLSGETVFPLDQASAVGWTVQTSNQSGALAGQIVVAAGTASSGNVYLSWL
jgi:hypothetical protein